MQELADMDLVRAYARDNSEEAFAALVSRHVNLVYSAAWRKTGNPAAAEEVTQAVFIILARKAGGLREGTILSGWLYQTARLTSDNFLRSEIRRARREQEAFMQSSAQETQPEAWPQIMPLLDDAMGQLAEQDRNAIALRFFEGRNFSEVGVALGTSEDAAKMRVNRALEKLRKFFTKRGVTSTAIIIAGAMSAHSVHAAPAGLAQAVTIAAAAKGVAAGGSTLTLVNGALKLMAWTKIKTGIVVGVVVLLAAGTTPLIVKSVHTARTRAALTSMKGDWEGTLEVGQIQLRMVLKIFQTNGVYLATIDSIDQGAGNIPVTQLTASGNSLRAALPALDADYQAALNADGTEMSGTFTQLGHPLPLSLKRTTEPDQVEQAMDPAEYAPTRDSYLQGEWEAAMKVGGTELHLALRIAEPTPGTFHAQFDSADQGAKNLPVTSLTYNNPNVRFELNSINGLFEGTIASGDRQIMGTWTQMGQKTPLTFQRAQTGSGAGAEAENDYGTGSSSEVMGHWKGALKVKQMTLHLVLNIARTPDGDYVGTMDSPDQGASGVPASQVDFTYPNLQMRWQAIGGVFTGKLQGGRLIGKWSQGPAAFPLRLLRDKTQ
jgi:RNA polymerase sigma factor (sigma-70 family)